MIVFGSFQVLVFDYWDNHYLIDRRDNSILESPFVGIVKVWKKVGNEIIIQTQDRLSFWNLKSKK